MESANQLAMKVASDDEDDAIDQLLEHQHQIMRSASAYSLVSNPEAGGQQVKGSKRERVYLPLSPGFARQYVHTLFAGWRLCVHTLRWCSCRRVCPLASWETSGESLRLTVGRQQWRAL